MDRPAWLRPARERRMRDSFRKFSSCIHHCFFVQYLRILDKTTVPAAFTPDAPWRFDMAGSMAWNGAWGWNGAHAGATGRGTARGSAHGAARALRPHAPGVLQGPWVPGGSWGGRPAGHPVRRGRPARAAVRVHSAPCRPGAGLAPSGGAGGRRPHGSHLGRHDPRHDVAGCGRRVLMGSDGWEPPGSDGWVRPPGSDIIPGLHPLARSFQYIHIRDQNPVPMMPWSLS